MIAKISLALLTLLSEGESKGGLLDVNPGLIFWTVITFVILLLILKKVAWKPLLTALDEREKLIKESLEKSERAKEEAEKLISENKANLAKAEEESQKVISQAREFAEKLKTQIVEESKTEAKKIINDATVEIERKNKEAFESLKNQIAEIAVGAAEKIIKENLDKEKQLVLVNKFIDELPKN